MLTKADPAVLTSMINAAFRLPEPSVRYLHGRLLEIPSLLPDDLRAEIAFREQAHAIPPYSALASANIHPVEAGTGIPDEGAHVLPPLVADIQPSTVASFPLRFRHAEAYIGSRTALIGDAAHVIHPLAGRDSIWGWRTQRHLHVASRRQSCTAAISVSRPLSLGFAN